LPAKIIQAAEFKLQFIAGLPSRIIFIGLPSSYFYPSEYLGACSGAVYLWIILLNFNRKRNDVNFAIAKFTLV